MSRASKPSTSSIPTLGSWDDLAKLGEYILAQLAHDPRSDNLLVHWVAHRLAENMQTAETADNPREREAARDAAALLIAQLWEARAGWPRGWPPDSVRHFVEGVERAAGSSYGEPTRLPPWLSTLTELETLAREERAAWLNAALLEVGSEELRRALDAAPDSEPTPDDLSDMRRQLLYHENAEEWIVESADEGEDPSRRADRARILERVLHDIAERRAALVKQTLKDARRGQRRKPAVRDLHLPASPRRPRTRRRSGRGNT
jgi:hypothetical protein